MSKPSRPILKKRSGSARTSLPLAVALLALTFLAAGLCSCSVERTQVEPPVQAPAGFSTNGPAETPAEWWTSFNDPDLNSLVEEALRDSFSLRVAWDRLDQARAVAARSRAPLWPSLDGSAGASQTASHSPGTPLGAGGTDHTTQFSFGLQAGYEVDLWGRVRSAADAALLDAQAAEQDLQAAAITLSVDMARTWFRLAEQQAQLALVGKQLETNRKYLEAITLRFRRGKVGATDVLQQRQLVEANRGERALIESNIRVLEHQLAVLLGKPPGSFRPDAPNALPELPSLPDTGLPAEWIRRRPDVRAAELRVQAADQRVAAAIADRFPKLSLGLTASTSTEDLRDLFDNWAASVAASLVAPLFDAGLRKAEVERTRAVMSQQLHSYGQVVLTSLKEVEDALAREARQAEYVRSLGEQLDLSRQAKEQTLDNYAKGTADFTRYLTTLLSYQQLQRSHLQARRDLVLFRIDLYRALAGGWSLPRADRADPGEDGKRTR